MPSHVETLLALAKISLLAELSTRQLDELARRARWRTVRPGQVIAVRGQPLEALIFVEDGALSRAAHRFGPGQVVDELAWMAPTLQDEELVVSEAGRILVIEREDFEELADDVPGLGTALCRALGERLRRDGRKHPLGDDAGGDN